MSKANPVSAKISKLLASKVRKRSIFSRGQNAQLRGHWASYEDFAEINAIYREHLPEPYPARVTLQVAGLPLGARVQIDAVVEATGKQAT